MLSQKSKEDFEKRVTEVFFKNSNIEINDKDIQKGNKEPIDVIVRLKIKIQVRQLDDKLFGILRAGKIFFGDRDFQKILEITNNAIKAKGFKKYRLQDTQDIILLLDALELSNLLRPYYKEIKGLSKEFQKEEIKNFKAVYIVFRDFNFRIK